METTDCLSCQELSVTGERGAGCPGWQSKARALPRLRRCSCLRLKLLLLRGFVVLRGCISVGQVALQAGGAQPQCCQGTLPGLGLQSPTCSPCWCKSGVLVISVPCLCSRALFVGHGTPVVGMLPSDSSMEKGTFFLLCVIIAFSSYSVSASVNQFPFF